jgi:hypothetical protein
MAPSGFSLKTKLMATSEKSNSDLCPCMIKINVDFVEVQKINNIVVSAKELEVIECYSPTKISR